MDWQEAIRQSKKGTATRKQQQGRRDITYIRYEDGSCYRLVAENGRALYGMSREAESHEKEGYDDWQPSE